MAQIRSSSEPHRISFDMFTLDEADESLWKGSKRIPLRPKSFALLEYLVEHPGCLVTKHQLVSWLWPDCNVGEGVLKHCVSEVRKALADTAESPRIIETARRRGYRFIGRINRIETSETHTQPFGVSPGNPELAGRSAELSWLNILLKRMLGGVRQVVFVIGERGIGKSALMDAFAEQVTQGNKWIWIARGQCIKSQIAAEPFLPFSEAIQSLCSRNNRRQIVATLQTFAPYWLLQMPSLINQAEAKRLHQIASDSTPECLLRQISAALEALSSIFPLIVIIEDLHQSDAATLELISYLGQRRGTARLLLLGTCRASDVAGDNSPLAAIKEELQMLHQQCHELVLPALTEEDVRSYLTYRFPNHSFPGTAARSIQQQTGGNPLKIVDLLKEMVLDRRIVSTGESWTLRSTLENC